MAHLDSLAVSDEYLGCGVVRRCPVARRERRPWCLMLAVGRGIAQSLDTMITAAVSALRRAIRPGARSKFMIIK